jgi:hypothetical protein
MVKYPENRDKRVTKYAEIIRNLDPGVLYSGAAIANFAHEQGLITGTPASVRISKQRVRIAMNRLASIMDFPDEGDGFITISGQAPVPGWYGSRWKSAVGD